MSIADRYPEAFSVGQLIGNTNAWDDHVSALRNKQIFFNSLNAGSDIPRQPDYYTRMPLAPSFTNLRTQPFNFSSPTEDIFSGVFSNATQTRKNIDLNQAVDYQNQINKVNELGPMMLTNALAGRFYNYF
jgi:hypothetical protein